jgi:hypothetical protein
MKESRDPRKKDSPAAAAPAALAKGRASVAAAPKRIWENGLRFSFGIADITFISVSTRSTAAR